MHLIAVLKPSLNTQTNSFVRLLTKLDFRYAIVQKIDFNKIDLSFEQY